MLEETGESWIDNLPITEAALSNLKEGYEAEAARLKKFAGVGSRPRWTTSHTGWTTERFHLEGVRPRGRPEDRRGAV